MYRILSSLFLLLLAGALASCTRGLANGPGAQPTVTFSANPATVNAGQSATLTWSSTNATSAQIDNGIGAVQPSGSMTVTPQQTTTYNITVMGAGGTATAATTVTVNAPAPAPTVTLSANPTAINSGQSSTLTWSSTNATSLSIDNNIGTVQASGSQAVTPTQTTTYTITATGAGGTATAQATVTVNAAPTVTITANPTSITKGQSSTLTVVATNANQVVVSNNVDQTTNPLANTGGTLTVTPMQTTTYTATATGAGNQTATAMATVTITTPQDETAINHVIFMMQENRSFDSYFGMLNPYRKANNFNIGDDGKEYDVDGIDDKLTKFVNLDDENPPRKFSLFKLTSTCIDDSTSAWLESFGDVNRFDFSTGRKILMDGFVHNAAGYARSQAPQNPTSFTDLNGERAMGFYDQGFLNYYYFMASNFALSDRWFSPVASKTALNRIATLSGGTTQGDVHDPLNDDKFPQLTYETIFQELSQANVSWKIYYSVTDDFCPVGNDDCTHSSNPIPSIEFLDFNYSTNFLQANPNHGACPSNMQPSSAVGDKSNSFCIDTSHIAPITQYFKDVAAGTLPSFAYIDPGFGNNDEHPGALQSITAGQHQVSTIINALMQSPSWADSVFFFSYDEGGGPFDHVPPVPNHTNDFTDANLGVTTDISSIAVAADQFAPCPAAMGNINCDLVSYGSFADPGFQPTDAASAMNQGFAAQLGFRVPNMIISPFVRKHYVAHTPMDHTAIIKFVENRFIGSSAHLTNRDAAQPDLLEFFDFVNVPWKTPPTGIPTPSTAKACHADNMGP